MPLSKEFYLDEIKSKYPNSYNESLKDLPIKDLEDMLDFLESALEKADGGSIGIEVLFGPKREDFSIGGRAKPTQTYDPRASAVDYATALEKVGGGTAAQKRQDLSNYLGNLISTQGQKLGNAGVMALQGAKGVLGIQGTPITDSMQTSLQNIIQKQIQDTGKLSGNINYLDYGVLTDRKGQEFLGFGDRSFTDPEAALATTLGKASYAVDPRTGKVTFTGGTAYDFGDDQFGGLGKFISKGGVFSDKATQYNPDIGLSSDFMKQYNPSNISQSGVLPGFTKLRNPNSSPGNYNEFMYKGPDGQIYGSQTYASMAASGSYKDIYKDYYSKQKLAEGGRVGLFMGGPPLEGTALSIYNSMSEYGFSDQQIANALQEQGLYGGDDNTNNQVTTVQDVINQNANPSGSKLERELIGPGKLKEQYKAQLNNPISNAIYDFKENMTTKLSDPTTKIGKLGINASNVLGSAIGAVAGIPGLGFVLDKLSADSTFDRGAIRELNAPMQLGIYNPDKTGTGYFTQGPIQPGISSLSDTYKSGLTDGKFAGVTVDDLGRIQQTGDYNTAENVMAGYNAGFDLGATAFDRYDKIDETIEKEKKKTNVNYAKIKSLQKRQQALTDFALANAAAQRKAKQAAIDRAIARDNKEAEERARVKSITAGYGGHDDRPGATGPTAAGAGMGVGGGYASDYGFLKDGGLATMFKKKR